MPISGSFRDRFAIAAAPTVVRDHFADLDRIVANYGPLARSERIDAHTITFVLAPQNYGITTFHGRYTCRYQPFAEDRLTWQSVGDGTITASGEIRCTPDGRGGTSMDYQHQLGLQLDVNALLLRAIAPVAAQAIARESRAYVERMITDLLGRRMA
jgi:hypothetical protein